MLNQTIKMYYNFYIIFIYIYMKILVLIILFILLYILLNKNSKIEKFINRNKKIKIGFLIPTTSKNRNYKKIEEIYFIKIFIINLIPTISKNFEYEIYLGYDYDDLFYINNNIKIKNYFNNNTPKNISLSFYKFKKEKGSLSVMWNTLAKEAYNSCDYFYQCGDDIKFYDSEWSEKFVNVLKKNNNIGVTGPLDLNNKKLLTQSFVHKTHYDIFGYYYPPSIKNWYVDDWIHQVYQPNNNFWLKEIKVRNSGGPPRYQVNKNKNIFYEELNKGKNKLNNFLNQKETFSNITTNSDYIISMFLTGGLNEEAHNCIHTLKKVGMANNLIVTCLDKKAYDYISKLGVETVYRKTDLSGEAKFGSQKFYNIMKQKIEIIKELLIKYNKIVVYTDTDIVFLKNIMEDINKFKISDKDLAIQNDVSDFNIHNKNHLCAGFMFLKPNKLIFKTLDKILDLLNVGKADGGTSDQKVLNIVIQETKPNIEILDLKDYPNGSRYFNNIDLIYKDYKPKIIHNNYIIGTQNKIDRFKKHNLWFLNNENFENIQYRKKK